MSVRKLSSTLIIPTSATFKIYSTTTNRNQGQIERVRFESRFGSPTCLLTDSLLLAKMSTVLERCIQPNPDIAGIGVRISIYVQSLASVVRAVLYAADGLFDLAEQKQLTSTSAALEITAQSLVLAAIIQACTSGLSTYHALIVLNLSWMLIAATLVGCTCAALFAIPSWSFKEIRNIRFRSSGMVHFIILPTIHLLLVGSFGIWVWVKIKAFGDQPECTPGILITFLGRNISVMNPTIRTTSLISYALALVPVLNILGVIALVVGCSSILKGLLSCGFGNWRKTRATLQYLPAICIPAFIIVTFIIDTELMIERNKAIIFPGESQWTFGQTLSMILTVPVLGDIIGSLQVVRSVDRIRSRRKSQRRSARELVITTYIVRNPFSTNLKGIDVDVAADAILRFVDDLPIRRSHGGNSRETFNSGGYYAIDDQSIGRSYTSVNSLENLHPGHKMG